ncbi:MAG TPA: hypothetical protein VGL77_12595 [Armatimonadota bacterium]|jgi:hypothetical protein
MHRLLRWLITGGTGGLVVLLGLTCLAGWRALPGALAAMPTVPAVVRAQRLVVLDATGAARAALGMEDAAAALTLYDQDSNRRLTLSGADDAFINWMDGRQRLRLTCGITEEFGSALAICLAPGDPRIGMGLLPDGSPSLTLADSLGTSRITFEQLEDGVPKLTVGELLAPRHGGAISLGLTRKLMPMLALYNREGPIGSSITLRDNGEPLWLQFDRAHKIRVGLGIKEGECSLALYDEAEHSRLIMGYTDTLGPECTLYHDRQAPRVKLRVQQRGGFPLLIFFDNTTQRIVCRLNETDDAFLTFSDGTQHVRCMMLADPELTCFDAQEIQRTMVSALSDDGTRYLQFCDTSGKALLWSAPPVR